MANNEENLAEEVVAQSSDVVAIRDALNLAYYQNVSLDMVEAYRAVDREGRTSQITKQLEEALQKAQALIELAKGNDEDEEKG